MGTDKKHSKNGGKTIEFRKYDQLPKAMTPLTEGVTPTVKRDERYQDRGNGKSSMVISLSCQDLLILTAIDNNIVEATTLIGSQAGRTLDTISREVLAAGTNVQYAEGQVTSRAALTPEMKLTVKAVKKAVRFLKKQNAKKINGYYYGIVHPDCSYDLTEDARWIDAVKYKNPERIYNGEIERLRALDLLKPLKLKIWAKAGAAKAHLTLQRLMCMEL